MEAIEFRTRIRNGMIQIPRKYVGRVGDTVKVIIMTEERERQTDLIDDLLENPLEAKNFAPLSRQEIYEDL